MDCNSIFSLLNEKEHYRHLYNFICNYLAKQVTIYSLKFISMHGPTQVVIQERRKGHTICLLFRLPSTKLWLEYGDDLPCRH